MKGARQPIGDMLEVLQICAVDGVVLEVARDSAMADFEDAVQVAAAAWTSSMRLPRGMGVIFRFSAVNTDTNDFLAYLTESS